MKLMQQQKQQTRTRIIPPAEIKKQAQMNAPLIIVDRDFDKAFVPNGYTKLKLKTPSDEFIALVKQGTMFYLDRNNLSNENIEEGLKDLSELYNALTEADDIFGKGEEINVGGVDLATTVRQNYRILLTNSLVAHEAEQRPQQKNPDYNRSEIERLCLEHSYVDHRMRAIAAIIQGKSVDEIRASELSQVLGFEKDVTIESTITREELRKIADREYTRDKPVERKHSRCTGESYWYLKSDLRDGRDGWDYNLQTMTKTRTEITADKLRKIDDLEKEITTYQAEHSSGTASPNDLARTRVFMNMKYDAGLNISPVVKTEEKNG